MIIGKNSLGVLCVSYLDQNSGEPRIRRIKQKLKTFIVFYKTFSLISYDTVSRRNVPNRKTVLISSIIEIYRDQVILCVTCVVHRLYSERKVKRHTKSGFVNCTREPKKKKNELNSTRFQMRYAWIIYEAFRKKANGKITHNGVIIESDIIEAEKSTSAK